MTLCCRLREACPWITLLDESSLSSSSSSSSSSSATSSATAATAADAAFLLSAATLCLEHGKDAQVCAAGRRLVQSLVSDPAVMPPHFGTRATARLAARFLALQRMGLLQRASRVLGACLDSAAKAHPDPHAAVRGLLAHVPGFPRALVLGLREMALRRPAAKMLEHLLCRLLEEQQQQQQHQRQHQHGEEEPGDGKEDGAKCKATLGLLRTLLRATIVDARDARDRDDLAMFLSAVLQRATQLHAECTLRQRRRKAALAATRGGDTAAAAAAAAVPAGSALAALRPRFRNLAADVLGTWAADEHTADEELCCVLSCLRVCSALDPALTLSGLLAAEDDRGSNMLAFAGAGAAVLHALTSPTHTLPRVQALELCCGWLAKAPLRPGTTAEAWALSRSSVLRDVLAGITDVGVRDGVKHTSDDGGDENSSTARAVTDVHYAGRDAEDEAAAWRGRRGRDDGLVQRVRSVLARLCRRCPPLRAVLAEALVERLRGGPSLRHGRLLLSLVQDVVQPPSAKDASAGVGLLPAPTLQALRERVMGVLRTNDWAEVRELAASVLAVMGRGEQGRAANAALLVGAASAGATAAAAEDGGAGANGAFGQRSSPAALRVMLEYHAECGRGGDLRALGPTAVLEGIRAAAAAEAGDTAQRRSSSTVASEAVAVALVLPIEYLLPRAGALLEATVRLLAKIAPRIPATAELLALDHDGGSRSSRPQRRRQPQQPQQQPDFADAVWVAARGCCELIQRMVVGARKHGGGSVNKQNTGVDIGAALLAQAGTQILALLRRTDHHGAMQRGAAALREIAISLACLSVAGGGQDTGTTTTTMATTPLGYLKGWVAELVERAAGMREMARIRFSHDLPPCLLALLSGLTVVARGNVGGGGKNRPQKRKRGGGGGFSGGSGGSSGSGGSGGLGGGDDGSSSNSNPYTECLFEGCVRPLLDLAACKSAHVSARIAAFHVLVRVFEKSKIRALVCRPRQYNLVDAVDLAIGCCEEGPYALSSAAALFWSVIIEAMTASEGRGQCSPCTLFLAHPRLQAVVRAHADRATRRIEAAAAADAPIQTGLSTPLVLLSLVAQLSPPAGPAADPPALHRRLCAPLVRMSVALLGSPQMLLRQLAAKALARLTHPRDAGGSRAAILRDVSDAATSMNILHGRLLQLDWLEAVLGEEEEEEEEEHATAAATTAASLQALLQSQPRLARCECTRWLIDRLSCTCSTTV